MEVNDTLTFSSNNLKLKPKISNTNI